MTRAYLSAAATVGDLLRSPALAARWSSPSALDGFTVSGLAGHTARGVFNVETYLGRPIPDGPAIDAVTYYLAVEARAAEDPAIDRDIIARGEQDAGSGPQDLIQRYETSLSRVAGELTGLDGARLVAMVFGQVLTLRECLVTRLVELVVHADDLAVSLDLPEPAFDDEPAAIVVATLAEFARRRHGTPALVRTLARRERAPASVAGFQLQPPVHRENL